MCSRLREGELFGIVNSIGRLIRAVGGCVPQGDGNSASVFPVTL